MGTRYCGIVYENCDTAGLGCSRGTSNFIHNFTAMCDEERRAARTLASKHVAQIYACTEEARVSLAKMGKYAEEMISITKNHMESTLDETRSRDLSYHRTLTK